MAPTNRPQGTSGRRAPANRRAASSHQNDAVVPTPDLVAPATQTAARRGRAAVHSAVTRNATNLDLPVIGRVTLPPPESLVWFGGMAALVAFDMLEWPVAVVLGVGKVLSENRHHKIIQDLGEALEAAR